MNMKTKWHLLVPTALFVVCSVSAYSEPANEPQKELPLNLIAKELKSEDQQKRTLAEKKLLRLGPGHVPELRSIDDPVVLRILQMHDRIASSTKRATNRASIVKMAKEAITYFSSKGAVEYLGIGLESSISDIRLETACALRAISRDLTGPDRSVSVRLILKHLNTQPAIVEGGEDVVISEKTSTTLLETLRQLLETEGVGDDLGSTKGRAEQWLKEHP